MKTLFVVPCRYNPVVRDCVRSIRTHEPDAKILLVDSWSPDESYLLSMDVDYVRRENCHYMTGAYQHGAHLRGFDRYAFIHDSLELTAPLSAWLPDDAPLGIVRFVDSVWGDPELNTFGRAELARMGIDEPPDWWVVFGAMFFCDRATVDQLHRLRWFDAKPVNKSQASATERTLGIALRHLGHNVREVPCAQGHHGGPDVPADESFVRKTFLDRA